jgi:hypothetical protein
MCICTERNIGHEPKVDMLLNSHHLAPAANSVSHHAALDGSSSVASPPTHS